MDEKTESSEGFRERFSARGEEALGDLAQALLENPLLNQALSAAFGAREKAAQAQKSAMGALNLPSASELERLERRLRSLSERLEGVEEQLDEVARDMTALRRQLAADQGVSSDQESLKVENSG